MLKEFREFAMKGNVVDLAVAVIIGAAFGAIVNSMVADVIMPPIGLLLGGIDFSDLKFTLKDAVDPVQKTIEGVKQFREDGSAVMTDAIEAVTINYGVFLNNVISFLIVAFAVFMLVKTMNSLKKKEEEAPKAPAPPPAQEVLLTEIRDLLAKK